MDNAAEKKIRRCTDEANLARQEEILETATELFAEQRNALPSAARNTSFRSAPSAIRIPSSRSRLLTE